MATEAKGTEILGRNIRPEKEYKVKTYDFKRPDKFSKDQMRTLSMMHETFARLASTALSSKLRLFIKMHVASVDQLTYEEFIRSIPHPTVLAPVRLDPLKGPMLLELDPSLGFAGVERLFGGVGRKIQPERAVTDVEMKLLEELFSQAFLANLRESWANIIAMQPQLGQMETNK